ncbi:MAG: hypothetical protein ACNA8W_05110 [Bradymonadaceae bacterium]
MRSFSYSFPAALLTGLLLGCGMPGIPLEGLDQPGDDDSLSSQRVCVPEESICKYGSVQSCSQDGTDFVLEACPLDTSCSAGACVPIGERCDAGQPFGISVGELVFESSDLLKTQTRGVTVINCGQAPLFVQRIDLRSPERADGNPVFVFASERPLMRELAPGESLEIEITYRPDGGLTQDRGWLELGVISDGYIQTQVPLRTRSFCVTTSPSKDLGPQPVAMALEDSVYLHNCGTEALTLRRIAVENQTTAGPSVSISSQAVAPPFVLEAGNYLRIPFTVEAEQAGPWAASLAIEIDDAELFALENRTVQTHLSGIFYHTPCREVPVGPLLIEGVDALGHAEPFSKVSIKRQSTAQGLTPIYQLTEHPARSLARPMPAGSQATFEPDVVGTYQFIANVLDQEGHISCEPAHAMFEARPSSPLYIELTWETMDDKIADDEGLGRGVDLNLHVLASVDDSSPVLWNDTAYDCRQYIRRTGRACPGLFGHLVSTSRSGARPEALAIESPEGYFLQIGVHTFNAYAFGGARAHLRVYRDGVLVPAFHDAWTTLHYTGSFWLVGRIDGHTGDAVQTNIVLPQMP